MSMMQMLMGGPQRPPGEPPARVTTAMGFVQLIGSRMFDHTVTSDYQRVLTPRPLTQPEAQAYNAALDLLGLYFKCGLDDPPGYPVAPSVDAPPEDPPATGPAPAPTPAPQVTS